MAASEYQVGARDIPCIWLIALVADQSTPLDAITLATSCGLLSNLVPGRQSVRDFNLATELKLGPVPLAQKLKDQIAHELRDEVGSSAQATGADGSAEGASPRTQQNGVDANGDVEMVSSPAAGPSGTTGAQNRGSPAPGGGPPSASVDPKPDLGDLFPNGQEISELVSPSPEETIPPTPALFRIVDLKREVEAIRDKRKMIRLGPSMDENAGAPSVVLPSVVAFTVFDQGEG